jgi:membrane fusion protein (multidrug efflux system)
VSFVLRTGTPILLPRIGQDPRYEPEADNDSGAKDERFLALPISDKNGRSIAVLVVLRRGSRDPFGTAEQRLLATMVEHAAPFVGKFALERELDAMVTQKHGALGSQAADIFRREALVHHSQGLGDRGNVLELSPAWTRLSYKLLLAVFVGGLIYSVLGSIYEYASGVAVIRVSDRTDVTSTIAGTTIEVEVSSGQTVAKGQLLARFYGARELANLTRIRHEFEVALAQRLRNPSDLAAERNLSSLRAQREQAEAELEERSVRAPRSGIISDLRIRPGQHLVPGDMILSLVDENPTLEVLAIFPGQYRPQIKHGMKIRLELTGYRYAYQHLQVEDVTQEVVGPSEARRMLGPGIGDAVALSGPVVFVRATLPMDHFESDGKSYRYHDGMQGLAEVRIRRERILTTLIPGLKSAFSNRHG